MQCKELEAVLEAEGLSPLPLEAREHLGGCSHCQDLFADFSTIVVTAKSVPAEIAPPDRVWVSLRAQLEAEGIIRDSVLVATPSSAPWWNSFAEFFRPRALATAAAVLFLVAGGVYVVDHHNSTKPVSTNTAAVPQSVPTQVSQTPAVAPEPAPVTAVANPKPAAKHNEIAGVAPQPRASSTVLRRSPSEEAYLGDSAAVLAQTEDSLPRTGLTNNAAVDASLRQNLRTLNEFIAECESRLKQNPQDQLTREYLNMAYQQKAELLTAMMDSGRSEH
ncbi:MAG: anti-sigma factor [Candidatus Acidiferrum sp.]